MKRSSLNFNIDMLSLIDLVGLIITGFIIKFILPPGTGGLGRELHGAGKAQNVKYLWSTTRHQWGTVHFYFAIGFVILIIIHFILHWGWIEKYCRSLLKLSKFIVLF